MESAQKPSLDLLALSDEPDGHFPVAKDSDLGPFSKDSFFKSVQWQVQPHANTRNVSSRSLTPNRSADGTTLLTSSYGNRICSYVLPENLLEPKQEPALLRAQGTLIQAAASNAFAPCPYWALENPATQAVLVSSTDHPIQLHYAFPPPSESGERAGSLPVQPPPIASFHLIKRETEAYLPIASLIWPAPGTHFVAGTTNRLAVFDVSRSDAMKSEPLLSIPTIPSTRHISKGNGIGMRGTVAALSAQVRGHGDLGLVAAGTWTRNMGLYDLQRSGECVATWNVSTAATEAGIGGGGVVQTVWSPCGRYLVVNERGASGLLVYDLRGTNQLLAHLNGRQSNRNQRLSCDVYPGTDAIGGFEVWTGDRNGAVLVWEGVGNEAGGVPPSWDWQAHECPIGGAAMHMSGSVLATCSGAWKDADDSTNSGSSGTDSDDSGDNSDSEDSTSEPISTHEYTPFVVRETTLKVWSIKSPGPNSEAGP